MGIVQQPTLLTGTPGVYPQFKYMVTTDNLATVTAAGYLNKVDLMSYPIQPNDIIVMLYSYNLQTNTGTYGQFQPNFANGVITLVDLSISGNVLLPVVSGDFAVFNGTTGQIKDSGAAPSAAAQPFVAMSPGSLTTNHVLKTSDANGTVADAGFLASNVMLLNAVNTLSGAASIVAVKANGTEATNAVTASGMAGVITTSSLTTAGGANYAITWTNTFIATTSVVLLTIAGGTNTTENITLKVIPGNGTATLTIYNNTAATNLNGTILISYLVM